MKLRYVPNILTKAGRKNIDVVYSPEKTLADYLHEAGLQVESYRVIIKGKPVDDLSYIPKEGEEIVVVPDIKDLVSAGAILYASFVAVASYAIANASTLLYLAFVIGSALYSAMSRPKRPSFGTTAPTGGLDESSPTYGWDGIRTTQSVGTPVPVVYGTHRVGGNIINQFVTTDGDKNYLNCLIALCEGEIDSISEVQVNKNPIANYTDIVEYSRMGTNDQAIIPNFDDLHNLTAVGVNLNTLSGFHVYTTADSDVEAFEVHLTLPSGLFTIDALTGSIGSNALAVKIEYAVHGGAYTTLFNDVISGQSRSSMRRIFRKDGLSPAQYDIKVTRVSGASSSNSIYDLSWTYADEIKTDDLIYPNTALYGVKALATDQLADSLPNFTVLVRGKKVRVPNVLTTMGGTLVDSDDYYYNPADDTFRLFSTTGTLYWDGTTYVEAYTANPVWCIRDLILNNRFGLGEFILSANFDDDTALEMAKYAHERVADGNGGYEHRFRLDVVLDSPSKAIDALTQLNMTYRGLLFFSQGSITLKIDKPETSTQLFTMGNIVKDSFSEAWKSLKDSPNVVEVQFMDAEKNYEQDVVAYIDEVALTAGAVMRKQSIRLFCTRTSQIIREARHAVNVSKLISRTIQFKAGIDSIAVKAGDVFSFSHDLPQWGYSGRVGTGSTTTSIVLDRSVTIAPATTYKLRIRHPDDSIEERTVSSSSGTMSTVSVSSAFTTAPTAYDVYAFGVVDQNVKDFRCLAIRRENTLEASISAVEYDEDVYDDTAPVLPTTNYSALNTTVPDVTGLDLSEGIITKPDGTVENYIDVWWDKPDDTTYDFGYKFFAVKIYVSDDGQDSWRLVGQSSGTNFRIVGGIDSGVLYYVKAVTVCVNGTEDSLSGAPTDSITTVGKTASPSNVSGFAYQFINDIVKLYWNPLDPAVDPDLAGYEIRDTDSNWGVDNSALKYRGLQTERSFEVTSRSAGTFYIRAFNRSNIYSASSASVTPTNSAPSAITGVGADTFFNVANVYWNNSSDADVKAYQAYISQTDAWAGEETLYGEVSGKSISIEGRKPRSVVITGVTSATVFTCDSLIGLATDYFKKDSLYVSSGARVGEQKIVSAFNGTTGQITLASGLTGSPAIGDTIIIYDVVYVKIRAVDYFGVGTFSSSYGITFENVTEDMLGDSSVTPRKMLVGQLSAITANMGFLTAGTITGATMQTATGGQRIVYNSSGIYGYNSSGDERFRLSTDGSVRAVDLTLYDPSNACNYSYLSAGSWYFHDSLGNSNPYPKRIMQGMATTGTTLDFCGWCCQPNVMVSIQSMMTYNCTQSASCQQVCVYPDTPVWYCCSSTCWGWHVTIHSVLYKSAGIYSETVDDLAFANSVFTHSDACCSKVRLKFQLWATSCVPTENYCYGVLNYTLKYKCCSSGVWCCSDYTYTHAHSNLTELQTTTDVCQQLSFGGASGCFEIQAICCGLTWCVSSVPQATLQTCCRTFSAGGVLAVGIMPSPKDCFATGSVALSGTNPSNVVCNTFFICCYEACILASFPHAFNRTLGACIYSDWLSFCEYSTCTNTAGYPAGTWNSWIAPVNITCVLSSTYNTCNHANICVGAHAQVECSSSQYVCMCSKHQGGYMLHCYYPTVSAVCCSYMREYSHTDATGSLSVLDSGGVLNWLAVSYG